MNYTEYKRISSEDAERYMLEAIALAKMSAEEGEVPIGCVIVRDGKIVGRGRNRRRIFGMRCSTQKLRRLMRRVGYWVVGDCGSVP